MSQVARFNLPYLHLVSPFGVNLFEIHTDLWRQNSRVTGLSCGTVSVILHLAIGV